MNPGTDYPGVGVGVMVLRSDGKFLLGRRAEASRNEVGAWTFPGGKVEFMEKVEDCAKREAREEFGIEIRIVRLLKIVNHFIQRERQHWVNPLFLAEIASGEPKIMEPDKFSRFGWFSVEELPFPLALNLQDLFADIKSGKIRID